MYHPIDSYGVIGNMKTAALVGPDGGIDWLCLPRFDSEACFAALLGTPEHGRWALAPVAPIRLVRRRYVDRSLVLETEMVTDHGAVRITDVMPPRQRDADLVRVVECTRGQVPMRMQLRPRLGYGRVVPWIRRGEGGSLAIAGPDALTLYSSVPTALEGAELSAEFLLSAGERATFVLVWHPSHEPGPRSVNPLEEIGETVKWWQRWSAQCQYRGHCEEEVTRSLLTLKALTYAPTGGIVAAATTSLPEWLGGVRNWDYRYCWLRDATFTLEALLATGFLDEARAWHDWLLRAVGGDPSQLQVMYGCAGERQLIELELPWLPGYEGSRPVRVGNAAVTQLQIDTYGELMDCFLHSRCAGLKTPEEAWNLERGIIAFVEQRWRDPDDGIWESRGGRRHYTHSRVMAWVAVDRAIKSAERFGLIAPLERWRALREEIRRDVLTHGFDERRNTFTQELGGRELDAATLMIPLVGFLPPEDSRVRGTVEALERELMWDGLLVRYRTEGQDGLPRGEGAFLACSFWLAQNYHLLGRHREALELLERLLDLANDVGLMAEEYDPAQRRMLGNFPQAFSHVAAVNTIHLLSGRARRYSSIARSGGPEVLNADSPPC
jgi:GH15 family glucan-1,4-alpha-glucosidase